MYRMRVPVLLFGHASCHFEIDGVGVWFNPTHAWAVAGEISSGKTAEWCLLTEADIFQTEVIAAWAETASKARFVAPATVASALISAGIQPDRVLTLGAETLALSAVLRLRVIVLSISQSTQANEHTNYLLDTDSGTLLLASMGIAQTTCMAELEAVGPIDTAFLPIGEDFFLHPLAKKQVNASAALSARVAFQLAQALGVRQVVASCAQTTAQGFYSEELRLVHARMGCQFNLLLSPAQLKIGPAKASVVVRTLNEARYLGELLQSIEDQETDGIDCEVVLVDSGSTDDTLTIAERFGCRILHITREDFSFGRSLNMGCEAASGDILIITSGHCVPADRHWVQCLCQPLLDGKAQYAYGKQLGGTQSHFSENRVFEKYFPQQSFIPQEGFYCNNANSALLKSAWQLHRFDEDLTGLEDMQLAQRLVKNGGKVAYVAEARVYHYHFETWAQVRRRFEREAIALQQIMPNVHVSLFDALRYTVSSILGDWAHARRNAVWVKKAAEIVFYRYHQYSGSYKGNHEHRKLSHAEKDKYFYPH